MSRLNPHFGLRVFSLAGAIFLFGVPALAHLELLDPAPRLAGSATLTELKIGPCGQQTNGRTNTVTEYAPGAMIEVSWEEYVNHNSYYRIAFDVDGDDDFPVRPNQSVSQEGDDPASINPVGDVILQYYMDDGNAGTYSTLVQLPNVECENCTLQVLQFMYNDAEPYYFQCADIALRAATTGAGGAAGSAGMSGMGGSSGAAAGGMAGGGAGQGGAAGTGFGGSAGTLTGGAGSAGTPTGGGAAGMGGTGMAGTGVAGVGVAGTGVAGSGVVTTTTEEPGCACSTQGSSGSRLWPLVALFGAVGQRLRRSRRRALGYFAGRTAAKAPIATS